MVKKCVCACVQENRQIQMWVHSCLLHTHLSTRTTWHLPMQWGIWCVRSPRCSIRCVWLYTGFIQNQRAVWCDGNCVWDRELVFGLLSPGLPSVLRILSDWLMEVTVLPRPVLPICFCLYAFACVNLNLAKDQAKNHSGQIPMHLCLPESCHAAVLVARSAAG